MMYRGNRLKSHTWQYRIHVLCHALGWSLTKLSKVSGIKYLTLFNIYSGYSGHMLAIRTIHAILRMEQVYAVHIKRYKYWPKKWDRLDRDNRARGLYPIQHDRPPDIKADKEEMAVLAKRYRRKGIKPYSRKEDYKNRGQKTAHAWANRLASGWNWHEARRKIHAGRSYYNMGRKNAMAGSVQAETTTASKKKEKK